MSNKSSLALPRPWRVKHRHCYGHRACDNMLSASLSQHLRACYDRRTCGDHIIHQKEGLAFKTYAVSVVQTKCVADIFLPFTSRELRLRERVLVPFEKRTLYGNTSHL